MEFDWKEIYEIFNNLPVEQNYKLKWNAVNEEEIEKILVDEHDFSEERVKSQLEKYNTENKQKNQKGLGEFF